MINYKKLNTIYIISKGRPKCTTARTLTRIKYPGEWFIVCGTNDTTLEEYQENWGERVLVFDWEEEVKKSDLLDNFGWTNFSSGAVPVRNATARISFERGEERHWQLDDDFPGFSKLNTARNKNETIKNGKKLEFEMGKIAQFGSNADLPNVGFQIASQTFPEQAFKFSRRVFGAHNLVSSPEKFVKWIGRMNDDLINAIDIISQGKIEMAVNYLTFCTTKTQTEKGGNEDLYKEHGTVKKTAYAIMKSPTTIALQIKFGRHHHTTNWKKISPKLIREEYKKQNK